MRCRVAFLCLMHVGLAPYKVQLMVFVYLLGLSLCSRHDVWTIMGFLGCKDINNHQCMMIQKNQQCGVCSMVTHDICSWVLGLEMLGTVNQGGCTQGTNGAIAYPISLKNFLLLFASKISLCYSGAFVPLNGLVWFLHLSSMQVHFG